MIAIPVTLLTAAACFFLNTWLGARIAAYRRDFKVSVGDGGHEPLLRRMRAQANFIEHAPFVLILVGGLELSGANRIVLGLLALTFVLARVAHGVGMDGGALHRWRRDGMITSTIVTLILAIWAIFVAVEALLSG